LWDVVGVAEETELDVFEVVEVLVLVLEGGGGGEEVVGGGV
jgi:hypothetical protein